jgi:hypothetical protein
MFVQILKTTTTMKRFILVLVFFISLSCNNQPSEAELQEKLKSTMLKFLYEKIVHNDSTKVKYKIIGNVVYYNDDLYNYYDCQFKVKMSIPGRKDTVGTMGAYISKDFKEVKRFQ